MRELVRLAGWGMTTTVALVLAVAVAYSPAGRQRLAASISGSTKVAAAPAAAPVAPKDPAQDARLAATEIETRRLLETVRLLSTDREKVLARIASLERNLEDVTGSIKRQAAMPAPPAPPAPSAATTPPVEPPATTAAIPRPVVPDNDPQPIPPGQSAPAAASPPPAAEVEETEDVPPDPALGVDVGGAVNFDGLRALWNSTRKTSAPQMQDLHPLVIVRENARNRAVELRLIVGPLADPDAAAQFCATLTAARRYCQPVPFEGQQVSLVPPEPPRRPAAAPKAGPAPRPPVRPNP